MANYKGEDRLEKHYTPEKLINFCNDLLKEHYKEDITELLESSAGSGNIINFLKKEYDKPIIAYDIFNETKREDIIECNYLQTKIDYKKGRVSIANPPFNLGLKFVKKTMRECDYGIFILSCNSILNFDYDNYIVDDIYVINKFDFGSCKVDICVIACKNKEVVC